ncbi:MAG: fumarylacetoacetate hydrolase family protein [Lentimicrobiaceae bacterium]|nr:fumarylacetoacetate hydrolase family protein [Lentimicrobiaceae bacterium]
MKIIRYLDFKGDIGFGYFAENKRVYKIIGDIFSDYKTTLAPVPVKKVLSPIMPSTILCIGLNYRYHAKESGMNIPDYPILFLKALNAVQNPGDPIFLPRQLESKEVDYEGELAVIIGKECKNVSKEKALEYVFGYTCANDVSARDWQFKYGGGQWCKGKTFDSFCPLGPHIVTTDEIKAPNSLKIRTILNGETVQEGNTDDMIFNVAALIEFLSGSTTLKPGTVILTGTPHGVGMASDPPRWLKTGDKIVVEIEKIGQLINTVEEEK